MNRALRATRYLVTATIALLLTGVAFLAVKTWAGMYLPGATAALAGLAGAFLPAYLLNKLLTRSYQSLEADASEWGSIFGVLLMINVLLVPVLWTGLLGVAPGVATQEAMDHTAFALGLLDEPSERTVSTFPASRMDTGVLWVPNLGTATQPRVIARTETGRLKVLELGPRGELLKARTQALIGPVNSTTGEVMLAPLPEDAETIRRIDVEWEGGVAHFTFSPTLRRAVFEDR